MTNVGTGNVLLQDDDMAVPHKGIDVTFRRSYNSQSQHDVAGSDGAPPGMYGNGWTNTFDAHLSGSLSGAITVWDIDGGRNDYTYVDGTHWAPPPGQHATLTYDSGCGMLWTKESGTSYYFWVPSAPGGTICPSWWWGNFGAYAGRLYQLIGRNRNTTITFTYSWDNGNSAPAVGKISGIAATTESGLAATMTFADVNGHRLLQQLTFPDGLTTVQYGYDANGNLTSVTKPANNAAGTHPVKYFGYQAIGSGYVLLWASSPRWDVCTPGCGNDGGYIYFGYGGSSVPTSALAYIINGAYVNPSISDGVSSGPIQPAYSSSYTNYLFEYFTTGSMTPTFRDTDGHMTNWIVDGAGRPTQTQRCTATANQGQQCTGTWLYTNESWDGDNNQIASTDERLNETDYAYDGNGNMIAKALPAIATAQGTYRPTSLYSYDSSNNVTAYCSPVITHNHVPGGDWTTRPTPPPAGQGLCPNTSVSFRFTWNPTTSEPAGELSTTVSPGTAANPSGYTTGYSYDPGAQGGSTDYGLPTQITGTSFTQVAGGDAPSTVQFARTYQYDAHGNVVCSSTGSGTWAYRYDSLNRQTVASDPDDGSVVACGRASSSKSIATYTTYYPDGSVQYTENPMQRAADVASNSMSAADATTYDVDGNVQTKTEHHGCASPTNCTTSPTQYYYDGADRVVEVVMPYDSSVDFHAYKWATRYLYDLSQGGSLTLSQPATLTSPAAFTNPFRAYGNVFDTQTYVDAGFSSNDGSPAWVDSKGTTYDALDRSTASYDLALGISALRQTTYDANGTTLGQISSMSKPTGDSTSYGYDADGNLTSITLSNATNPSPAPASAAAPSRTYTYDGDGHITATTSALGTETYTYDENGQVLTYTEPAAQGGNIVSYAYTPNGLRSTVSVTGALNGPVLRYSYRPDGMVAQEQVNNPTGGWQSFTWWRTPGGRPLQRSDPTTGLPINEANMPAQRTTFQPLTYAQGTYGTMTGVTYSNGYAVNGIATDLEGNLSAETDTETYSQGTNSYAGTHNSMPRSFSVRGEVATEGPAFTNISNVGTGFLRYVQADGIAVPLPSAPNSPPVRGVPLENSSNLLLNPLDGFETTSSGPAPDSPNGKFTEYVAYDAAGRYVSSDYQECDADFSAYAASSLEVTTHSSFDALDHSLSQSTASGSWGTTNGVDCTYFTNTGTTTVFSWGTSSHPIKMTSFSVTNPTQYNEYLHWDGDTLLFTSSSPSSGVDDIKVGNVGEVVLPSGNAAVYDRDSSGTIVDAHASAWNSPGISYNDLYVGYVPSPTSLSGSTPGMIVNTPVREPHGEDLSGFNGYSIQGVRATDASVGHWTTPDAFNGTIGDPMSQMPYMFDRGNPYRYSDPTGYCTIHSEGELKGIGCVDARPVPPPQQRMPNGELVRDAVARQQRTIDVMAAAMSMVTVGPEGAAAKVVATAAGGAAARALARRGASRALRRAMALAGRFPTAGKNIAHHIVAVGEPLAVPARSALARVGIDDLNLEENGVFISQAGAHTADYYNEVNEALQDVSSADEARWILRQLGERIANGTLKTGR